MKKIETKITLANGGMHSPRAYRKMVVMLTSCTYSAPRVYHIVLYGAEQVERYQSAIKAICAQLRRKGMPVQYKACIEVDKAKGFHAHCFLLIESRASNPDHLINRKLQGWLVTMLRKRSINLYICPPTDAMHRDANGKQLNYATLAGDKLADCIEHISYLVKQRSKPEGIEHIYFGSRPQRQIPKK